MKYLKVFLLAIALVFIITDWSFLENPQDSTVSGRENTTSDLVENTETTIKEAETEPEATDAQITEQPEQTTPSVTAEPPKETAVTEQEPDDTSEPITTEIPEIPSNEKIEAVIKTAAEQLGQKYYFGGDSPSVGFDNSGLLYYSCKQNGIDIPRNSSQQSKSGTEIAFSDLQRGDFMYISNGTPGIISYCGIYLGDGTMIYSAAGQGEVCIINVSSAYWEQHLVTARRII